ncbi:hypothetical protein [Actinomadura logoneensis]|uniref:hypothetical protein n=1 Tax=Actinomadura logoneensis TaxID=2293572 RepID=UPI0013146707|nr:hypothetical protein [Actinomadura logoneensis]
MRAVDQQQRQRVVGLGRLGQALGEAPGLQRVHEQDDRGHQRVGDREQPGDEPHLDEPGDQLHHAEREPDRGEQRPAELDDPEDGAVELHQEARRHGQQRQRQRDLGDRPGDQEEHPVRGGALDQQPGGD